jgi:hypothetical protein
MEARIFRAVLVAAVLLVSMGASYRTPNFIIQTAHPQLAEQFGKAAEKYRRDLAVAWLGEPMPDWSQPCPVTVHVGQHLGAGGATSFVFDRGEVFGWQMMIQGSAERILDSVLPHEITHMILACRFRQPVPRWADEGAATSVEHPSERAKHYPMLVQFLRSNRGIAFGRMFAMKEYPRDMMPLYAQGYTLVEFLIGHGGRRQFVEFLAAGMENDQWAEAAGRYYGFGGVRALQDAWLAWVGRGFPPIRRPTEQPGATAEPEMLAAGGQRPRPEPNLIYRILKGQGSGSSSEGPAPAQRPDHRPSESIAAATSKAGPRDAGTSLVRVLPASGWHAVGEPGPRETAPREPTAVALNPAPAEPLRTQLTRPQPIERPRQIILQWSKP